MKALAMFGFLVVGGCAATGPAAKVGAAPTATDIRQQREQTTRFDNGPTMNVFRGRRG